MKIAMIAAHSCPVGELGAKDTGGMSVYIRELSRELGKLGHTVDIFTRVHDPADPVLENLGEGVRLIHIKAGQEAKINKMEVFGYLPEFTRNLEAFRCNNNLDYDLIFSHYWMSGLVAQKLQARWRAPHVVMFHTLGAVKNAIGIGENDPALRIAAERELIARCQCVIAPTVRGKEELEQYYNADPGKISIIPCGVNMDLFKPVSREIARQKLGLTGEKILLFVGRLDPLKGAERLLEAVTYLDDYKSLKLVLIGGDESSRGEIERMQTMCVELGISGKVQFRGTVKQVDLPDYYSAADVCVVPSYYESFGLVPLEALACGTPVVVADIAEVKNFILTGKTGCVVRTNMPQNLARGIRQVMNHHSYAIEVALAVRESVRRYSWENVAGGIIREFNSVLAHWMLPVA